MNGLEFTGRYPRFSDVFTFPDIRSSSDYGSNAYEVDRDSPIPLRPMVEVTAPAPPEPKASPLILPQPPISPSILPSLLDLTFTSRILLFLIVIILLLIPYLLFENLKAIRKNTQLIKRLVLRPNLQLT
jgi:hypothetical protein